jgi:methanogenic corrinoid protein MtbC1
MSNVFDILSPLGDTLKSRFAFRRVERDAPLRRHRMPRDSMTERQEPGLSDPTPVLVQEILRNLRDKDRTRPARGVPRVCPRFLTELVDAALAPDFDAALVLRGLLEAGVPANDIADGYVPAAARKLGCDWVDDRLSFARVTVAAGRLQSLLGRLAQPNDAVRSAQPSAPNVLLVSFEGDQHTLGWKLLSVQLRRRGAAAHAVLDVGPEAVADIVEQAGFDLVLVSASRPQVLDQVTRMADALRARMVDVPPIVLGGIVVDFLDDGPERADIMAVTNCLDRALSCRKRRSALSLTARV